MELCDVRPVTRSRSLERLLPRMSKMMSLRPRPPHGSIILGSGLVAASSSFCEEDVRPVMRSRSLEWLLPRMSKMMSLRPRPPHGSIATGLDPVAASSSFCEEGEERREKKQYEMMTDPDVSPVKRSSSLEWLPPKMSELRVVLLGNSWSQRSSVGNFILGEKKFNTEEEPDGCLTERGEVKGKEIVLINTPDLLRPNISEYKLTEHVKDCVRLSDPGPHVFLLVLQPEDFTEEHKQKLCRFLQLFSDRSFDHSLVLISTPREESPGFIKKYMQHPPLNEMIRKCHSRFFWQKKLELPQLLTRLGQIVKENNGEHLRLSSSDRFLLSDKPDVPTMRRSSSFPCLQPNKPDVSPMSRSSSFPFLPPSMSKEEFTPDTPALRTNHTAV